MANHPLKINAVHGDDEMWLMSKGHHDAESFAAEAKRLGYGKEGYEDEYYELETPNHGLMRSIPNRDGGTTFFPAETPGPGVFKVTIALCHWVRPSRQQRAAKFAQRAAAQKATND